MADLTYYVCYHSFITHNIVVPHATQAKVQSADKLLESGIPVYVAKYTTSLLQKLA